jgi:TPP-dependent pyruvate/acetoin dehydrogenase alpha subunit
VSNHRCHGHYLIRTGDAVGLMAELMGKAGGVCGGRGGSQHLCGPNFYTNGILGSTVPIAAGMAYAEKKKQTGGIVVLFMGDGAFGEGTVYETFNMISLWKVPLLVVVENNGYAQTTPLAMNCAGKLSARAAAFDLSVGESQGSDVEELYDRCGCLVQMVRNEGCPHVEIIRTYRLCGHSKGDDFRPRSEIEAWRERDPLRLLASKLKIERREELETWARQKVDAAEALARQMPPPTLSPRQNL